MSSTNWSCGRTGSEFGRGKVALREGAWKYIHGESPRGAKSGPGKKKRNLSKSARGELYELDEDVAETTNVLEKHSDVAARMEQRMRVLIESGRTR